MTMSTVIIRHGGSHWQVDQAKLRIGAHQGPYVGTATKLPGIGWPGIAAVFAGFGNGMKNPLQLTGAHIEGAYVSRWRFFHIGTLGHGRADNHHISHHQRWRTYRI